ncbi:unnamed protein product [Prunus armeniaca]
MLHTALTQNPPLPDFSELRARILSFDAQQSRPATSTAATALFNHSKASSAHRDNRSFPTGGHPNNSRFIRGRHSQQQATPQSHVASPFPMEQQHVPSFGPFASLAWAARPPPNGLLGPAPQWCPNCHSGQHGLSQCPHRFSGPNTAAPFAGVYYVADPNWYLDGPCKDGLYPLTLSSVSTPPQALASVHSSIWHNRLGHPSSNVLARLGPTINSKLSFRSFYRDCALSKSHQLPFNSNKETTSTHFHIIHSDRFSCPYTPQQNGLAKHRHIATMTRSLLLTSGASHNLWVEALHAHLVPEASSLEFTLLSSP